MSSDTIHRFYYETRLNKPVDAVWDFFAEMNNLKKLTPKWMGLSFDAPEQSGTRVGEEVRLNFKVFGFLHQSWVVHFLEWEEGVLFKDAQTEGPFRTFEHTHRFESLGREKTLMTDEIVFRLPSLIAPLPGSGIVAKFFLRKMFKDRSTRLMAATGWPLSESDTSKE